MAITTPRGLKIRLEADWAFTLLGRLWQKDARTDAFRVLKTCEAIEDIPAILALLAGVVAVFYPHRPLWSVPAAIIAARLAGLLLTHFGMFVVLRPVGLLMLATIWSYVPSPVTFIAYLILIGMVLAKLGWSAVAVCIGGHLGALLVNTIVEFAFAKRAYAAVNFPLTSSEINFFNAYRLHADQLGLAHDLAVTDEEVSSGHWKRCLADYALKYPESVARFPRDSIPMMGVLDALAEEREGTSDDDQE